MSKAIKFTVSPFTVVRKLKHLLIDQFSELKEQFQVGTIKKKNIGNNSYVDPSVQVLGWKNVRIGQNSIISEDTWININHRESGISLTIGDNCFIGRRNFLSTGQLIEIKDYCLTAPDCKFLGSNHIYSSPFVPYITSGTTQDGVIEIGTNCWLGAGVTVLMGVKIGYGSVIGAATVVNRNIPPFSVVVGNPCKVVKRYDVRLQSWVNAKEYSDESDQYLPSESEYLKILKKTHYNPKGVLIASSKLFGEL